MANSRPTPPQAAQQARHWQIPWPKTGISAERAAGDAGTLSLTQFSALLSTLDGKTPHRFPRPSASPFLFSNSHASDL